MSAVAVASTTLPFAERLPVPDAALEAWPLPADLVIAGQPQASGRVLTQSADQRRMSGIWACTPGTFRWDWTCEETVAVVCGHASVVTDDGRRLELRPGDMAFFAPGVRSTWTIHENFRKAFHTFAEA